MKQRFIPAAVIGLAFATHAHAAEINVKGLSDTCNNCHGTGGVSVGPTMPSIAGLPEDYLKNIMMEWKTGKRPSANMTRLVSGLTDGEIAALAAHYSKLAWVPVKQKTDAKHVSLGKEVTEKCAGCHGETGKAPDAETPNLHGQWSQYLQLEAMKYRDDKFGMPSRQMVKAAKKLSEEQVKAVSEFYASQNK